MGHRAGYIMLLAWLVQAEARLVSSSSDGLYSEF